MESVGFSNKYASPTSSASLQLVPLELALRLRTARFIPVDAGLERELERAMSDMAASPARPRSQPTSSAPAVRGKGHAGARETHGVSLPGLTSFVDTPTCAPWGTTRRGSASTRFPGGGRTGSAAIPERLVLGCLRVPAPRRGRSPLAIRSGAPGLWPLRLGDRVRGSGPDNQAGSARAPSAPCPPSQLPPGSPLASGMRGGPGGSIPRMAVVEGPPSTSAIYHLQSRVTLGYAPSAFEASRHALGGASGAAQVWPWRWIAVALEAVALEDDTEK